LFGEGSGTSSENLSFSPKPDYRTGFSPTERGKKDVRYNGLGDVRKESGSRKKSRAT